MNSVQQIKSAVANIQDELLRILASSEVSPLEQSHEADEFKAKLIAEFNTKLRGFKSKIRTLNEENALLRERVAMLRGQLGNKPQHARTSKSLTSLPPVRPMAPPKRQRADSEERVEISSSPIKSGSQFAASDSRPDLTSSQLNHLPTQYSDASEKGEAEESSNGQRESNSHKHNQSAPELAAETHQGARKRPRSTKSEASPVKANFIEEDDRVVADSQDEFEPLANGLRGHPSHYTALQRIDFLRNYYRMKLADKKYKVELLTNPITEKPWVAADFQPNAQWSRPKPINSHVGVMTKAQEQTYQQFFQEAGHGVPNEGPQWEMAESAHLAESSDSDKENSPGGAHWVRSQVMDKYLSPPGYMVALFPDTQVEHQRKCEVARKAGERLQRRVASALSQGEFVFFEQVLNTYVAQGRYTRQPKH